VAEAYLLRRAGRSRDRPCAAPAPAAGGRSKAGSSARIVPTQSSGTDGCCQPASWRCGAART